MHIPKVLWGKFVFLLLYVNDISIASNDLSTLHEIKKILSIKFDMKVLGDISLY